MCRKLLTEDDSSEKDLTENFFFSLCARSLGSPSRKGVRGGIRRLVPVTVPVVPVELEEVVDEVRVGRSGEKT